MEAEYRGAGKGGPMAHNKEQTLMCHFIYLAGAIAFAAAAPAAAQISDDVVKLGVLTDMSSLYSDINGQGAIVATEMAIDDFGGSVNGKKIELISADVQNKADVAAGIAGRWFDIEHVDAILGAGASSSSIALRHSRIRWS
jgi:branched-chain amino acid transport system substrate-binding protein